jgi:hypothetical protein
MNKTRRKGETFMAKDNEPNIEFEAEGMPDEPQVDTILVLDGRGRLVAKEVEDDVADD